MRFDCDTDMGGHISSTLTPHIGMIIRTLLFSPN